MKTRLLLVLTFAVSSVVLGQDTTRARTLSSFLPFRGIHLDWGSATIPYLDHNGSGARAAALDARISLPLRRYPDWSIAFAATIGGTDTTSYVAPGSVTASSTGFHPPLTSLSSSLQVERRWNQRRMVHGIASAGAGTIANSYDYWRSINGVREYHQDEKTRTTFAAIAGGAELNIARWFRASLMVGYRTGGRMTIAQATGSNGGFTTAFNLELGKF